MQNVDVMIDVNYGIRQWMYAVRYFEGVVMQDGDQTDWIEASNIAYLFVTKYKNFEETFSVISEQIESIPNNIDELSAEKTEDHFIELKQFSPSLHPFIYELCLVANDFLPQYADMEDEELRHFLQFSIEVAMECKQRFEAARFG